MRLIFIRHGETYHSKHGLYQIDTSPLLPLAKLKEIELAKNLAILEPNALLVSRLARSQETGKLLSIYLDIPVRTNPLLNEFREPSKLAGREISKVNSYIFRVIREYENNKDFKEEDGESLREFILRLLKFRASMERSRNSFIVCVGHGFYMRLFMLLTFVKPGYLTSDMLNLVTKAKLGKLKCTSFEFQNGIWKLEQWNVNLASIA